MTPILRAGLGLLVAASHRVDLSWCSARTPGINSSAARSCHSLWDRVAPILTLVQSRAYKFDDFSTRRTFHPPTAKSVDFASKELTLYHLQQQLTMSSPLILSIGNPLVSGIDLWIEGHHLQS